MPSESLDYHQLFYDAMDLLENFEWPYDDNPPSNDCWSCGVDGRKVGFKLDAHKPDCPLRKLLTIYREETGGLEE